MLTIFKSNAHYFSTLLENSRIHKGSKRRKISVNTEEQISLFFY